MTVGPVRRVPAHKGLAVDHSNHRLKAADANLIESATPPQRPAVNRVIARRQRLRRELQRWLGGEVRAQSGRLPIGDWGD